MREIHKEIINFIKHFIKENGYSPSVKEIADALIISKSNAHHHLGLLKEKGYIHWVPETPRTIRVLKAG